MHRFVLLAFVASLHAQTCDPANPATFTAKIAAVKGQLRLARDPKGKLESVALVNPERLKPCLPDQQLNESEIAAKLASDLDAALALRKLFYWYDPTVPDADKPKQTLPPELAKPRSDWADYWQAYNTAVTPIRAIRTWSFFLDNLHSDIGALLVQKRAPTDPKNALLTFKIISDGKPWSDKLPQPWPDGLHVDRDDLAAYLDEWYDGLWRKERIARRLNDFFSRRGWSPIVDVTSPDAPPFAIRIVRALPIRQVTFVPPLSDDDRQRAIYLLLPTLRFNQAKERPICKHTTAVQYQTLDLSPAPGKCDDDPAYVPPAAFPELPFNQTAFGSQQPLLAALGFSATNGVLPDNSGMDIRIDQNAPQPKSAAKKPAAPVAPGNMTPSTAGPAVAAAKAIAPAPKPAAAPASLDACSAETKAAGACPQPPASDDKKGFIGAGFEYVPGQGVRPLAALEYQRLMGPGSVSLTGGSANSSPVLSGAMSFDFVGFGAFHHRISFNGKGGTDTLNNRLLLGGTLRERRIGGQGRGDVELYRNDLGHSVTIYGEGGKQTVELTDPKLNSPASTILNDALTSGAAGMIYTYSGLSRTRPFWLRFEPRAQGATAALGPFYALTASATYHQDSLGAFSFEVKAHYAESSRNTPVYEVPSFGGINSMRGFRADDVLARRLWSTQPEFWFAVPGTFNKEGKVASFLSQNVRLAAFFDAGAVYHTFDRAPSGLRGGPGAGVRVDFHQATLRFDWAYGLGQAATAGCCGKVYFSVSRPLF